MRFYYFRSTSARNNAETKNGEDTFFSSPGAEKTSQSDPAFFSNPSFFSPEQTKPLSVSQPGDKYEQEADAMADRVTGTNSSASVPAIQSKCAACQEEEVHRKVFESEDEEPVQRKEITASHSPALQNGSQPDGADISSRLKQRKGSGEELDEETKGKMEPAFGADFSGVRVHTDGEAQDLSQQLQAKAFTNGNDVYFNRDAYAPETASGKHLLAHELTHVVQQKGDRDEPSLLQRQDMCEPEENFTPINENHDYEAGACNLPADEGAIIDPVHSYAVKPFYSKGTVTPELGIRLHASPSPYDAVYLSKTGIADDSNIQPRGSSVTITGMGVPPHKGWIKIITSQNHTGWIEQRFIDPVKPYPGVAENSREATKPEMDPFTKRLHYIAPGETLEQLIRRYYKDYNYATGNDRRTIAHAFYILNESSQGVRLSGSYDGSFWKDSVFDRGFSESREIYGSIRLYANYWVKFPTTQYINRQRTLGTVSSRPDWKNTAISIGRGIQGFYEGVVSGFAQAGVDMVVDLWDLVKDIITGEIFEKGYDLVMQFIDLYEKEGVAGIWRVVSGFFKGIYTSFLANWNNPNPRARWKFIGVIVGNILFEILLAWLTGGTATAAKWSARAAKVMKKFPALGKVVTSGTKKLGKLKDKSLDKLSRAKELKLKKGLGFDDSQWTNYMSNRDKSWDYIKSKPELIELEMKAIGKSKPALSSIDGYDIEIKVPNGHVYRRKAPPDKGWCRFSNQRQGCGEIPVDTYIEKNKIAQIEEDLGFIEDYLGPHSKVKHPPGAKKQRQKTALGTFVHSKAYTRFINWMETFEGEKWLKANNYTKADFALDLPSGKVSREFVIDHPDYSKGFQPRIDVVDWDNALVHEIKPDGLINKGFIESQQYAEWMNKYHGRSDGKLWKAGDTIAYDSNKIYEVFKDFGYFD